MLSWRTSNDNNVETFDVMYDNMLLEITQLTTRCVAAETQNELLKKQVAMQQRTIIKLLQQQEMSHEHHSS
jgi:hypothetical protein